MCHKCDARLQDLDDTIGQKKESFTLGPDMFITVYLTYYNSVLLYLEKVCSTFKVTLPVVRG